MPRAEGAMSVKKLCADMLCSDTFQDDEVPGSLVPLRVEPAWRLDILEDSESTASHGVAEVGGVLSPGGRAT